MIDRKKIIDNVLSLRVLPPITKADSEANYGITRIVYQLRGVEKLDDKNVDFLISHPEAIFTDDSQYQIIKTNSLKYEVFVKNNIRARFFQQDKSVEYVLFLMGLI